MNGLRPFQLALLAALLPGLILGVSATSSAVGGPVVRRAVVTGLAADSAPGTQPPVVPSPVPSVTPPPGQIAGMILEFRTLQPYFSVAGVLDMYVQSSGRATIPLNGPGDGRHGNGSGFMLTGSFKPCTGTFEVIDSSFRVYGFLGEDYEVVWDFASEGPAWAVATNCYGVVDVEFEASDLPGIASFVMENRRGVAGYHFPRGGSLRVATHEKCVIDTWMDFNTRTAPSGKVWEMAVQVYLVSRLDCPLPSEPAGQVIQ